MSRFFDILFWAFVVVATLGGGVLAMIAVKVIAGTVVL